MINKHVTRTTGIRNRSVRVDRLFVASAIGAAFVAVFALLQNGFAVSDGIFFVFAGCAGVMYLLSRPVLPETMLIASVRFAGIVPAILLLLGAGYLLAVMIVNIGSFSLRRDLPLYDDIPADYQQFILLTHSGDSVLFRDALTGLRETTFLKKTARFRANVITSMQMRYAIPKHFLIKLYGAIPDTRVLKNVIIAECAEIDLLLADGQSAQARKKADIVLSAVVNFLTIGTDVAGYTAALSVTDAFVDEIIRYRRLRSVFDANQLKRIIDALTDGLTASLSCEREIMNGFIKEPDKGTLLFTGDTPAARRLKLLYNYGGRWPFTSASATTATIHRNTESVAGILGKPLMGMEHTSINKTSLTWWSRYVSNPFGNYFTFPAPDYFPIVERQVVLSSRLNLLAALIAKNENLLQHDPLTGKAYEKNAVHGVLTYRSAYTLKDGSYPVVVSY